VAVDDGSSDSGTNLLFYTNKVGAANNGLVEDMVINPAYGAVGVGLNDPQSYGDQLVVFAASGVDALYGQGSTSALDYYSSGGVIGQGGGNTSGTYAAGDGGVFFGGDASGSATSGRGIYATAGSSATGPTGYAGEFYGNVYVTGTLSAGTKDFKIDHPLDPGNRYLVHASVESSEMMNIYSGNVTTDAQGLATVAFPDWFESLNTDFRYQLTVIGQFAQAIIAQKIANKQFSIKTSIPRVEVSWQVTAVRQDAFAKANPLVVEQLKPAAERGYYLHRPASGKANRLGQQCRADAQDASEPGKGQIGPTSRH
jgi:hypothetical protein